VDVRPSLAIIGLYSFGSGKRPDIVVTMCQWCKKNIRASEGQSEPAGKNLLQTWDESQARSKGTISAQSAAVVAEIQRVWLSHGRIYQYFGARGYTGLKPFRINTLASLTSI
jgi:hypothetical protein